ncbi:hypothetical protein SAMN05877838_3354 [Hoeflea halophila]|uniref:DUF1344 domain-containing protein n=1 Tax=Hoeflea halophila TaxID=714899 RepID=A0A286IE86_9HYPH|nr:hypothetical protein [Hoeflea halophila]SOE18430.1 hypothetical protein SAMN05877838_3354 [Hoeflea halophila]
MRLLSAITLLGSILATPALADTTGGVVVAYDRVDRVLVLDDKTVWDLTPAGDLVPDGLSAGDKVTIEYESAGDSGVGKITAISVSAE